MTRKRLSPRGEIDARSEPPVRALTRKQVATYLASLPAATLSIQWGNDHVYKVGGKMFAVIGPEEGASNVLSFKADEMSFEILTKKRGIVPAPYLARAKWVAFDEFDRLPAKQLKAYLERAHTIVAAGLTRKARKELGLSVESGN